MSVSCQSNVTWVLFGITPTVTIPNSKWLFKIWFCVWGKSAYQYYDIDFDHKIAILVCFLLYLSFLVGPSDKLCYSLTHQSHLHSILHPFICQMLVVQRLLNCINFPHEHLVTRARSSWHKHPESASDLSSRIKLSIQHRLPIGLPFLTLTTGAEIEKLTQGWCARSSQA